jgi:hypothetical protein
MKARHLPLLRNLIYRFILVLVIMTGFILQGIAQTVVTNPGNPWTVPAGVTSIKVEVWGGGGGGGGITTNGFFTTNGGGGGGGGAYRTASLTVTSGQTYTITIGAAGTAGGAGAAGGNGGTTTVSGTAGSVTVVGGTGGGGGNNSNGSGGAGGAGGTFNGGAGGTSSGNGAGGGGGAGNNASGGAGGNAATGTGGAGSPNYAPYIGGTGGAYRTSNGVGNAGAAPSGGGGGGRATAGFYSTSTNNGGIGGAGQVVITYTACTPPAAPSVTTPVKYCLNSTASQLTATGSGLLWYTVSTGGTGSSIAPTPSTSSTGTTSYYVSQTIGCEGPRAQIDVNVNPSPSSSVTGQTNVTCYAGTDGTITISASGGTDPYQFSVDNGATYIPGTNTYTYTGLSAGVQYKIRVKDSNGCESPAIP